MSKEKETVELSLDQQLVKSYLNAPKIKPYHLNGLPFRGDYKISTGSKIFDSLIGGGFGSGLVRFVGPTEAGKTAEALQVQENFLNEVDNSKGILVKAEGRLDENMTDRVGTKFVSDPEDWVEGTCWVFECNVYEIVFDLLTSIVTDRDNKVRYCIIIDSMDGLIRMGDLNKKSEDAAKVAGGAVMTGDFLRRTNLYMGKFGHLCIMMAQVRAEIKISQFDPKDKNKLGGASGGNASVHYPNWVIEYMRPNQGDYFLPNKEAQISMDNKPFGRNVPIKICKSTNETTSLGIRYPIKFGRKGRSAIWAEKETLELLMSWGYFDKKGSWFKTSDSLTEFIGEEVNIQGMKNWLAELEENADLAAKLSDFVDENIMSKL